MPDREEEVGPAARALAEAVTALTRAVGAGLTDASKEVGEQLATSLRDASRDLAQASTQVRRSVGDRRQGRDETRRRAGNRRQEQAERTRADLLAAARRVFSERGYEGASVGDVAAAAGYTKGAVYANFAGKEDLLRQIVLDLSDEQDAWFTAQAGRPLADVFAEACDPEVSLPSTLLSLELFTYAIRHREARDDLAPYLSASWSHAARLIAAARRGADAEPTPEERDTALAVLSVLTFSQVLDPVVEDGSALRAAARIIDRLLTAKE
ncbi:MULTISPECIES: helix-turn-helix domain-containing protein [unclassified Microbacterium]|uniref:helix-turn-helix domain-containing protein n=1 Tax=unclassified Microbacterium TaxID=2609290 RepID=UPI0030175BAD